MMCMVFVHPVTIQLQRMYAKKRQGQGFECLTLVLPTDALSRDDVGVIAAAVGDEILEVGGLGPDGQEWVWAAPQRRLL